MDQIEIVAYTGSERFVFGGQRKKLFDEGKYWKFQDNWDKNITLTCPRFCPKNGVHLGKRVDYSLKYNG